MDFNSRGVSYKTINMPSSILIPHPCHEDWNAMQPSPTGRHCLSCDKTVTDFTRWEPDAIQAFLSERKHDRICGRFRPEQLNDSPPLSLLKQINLAAIPFTKKVAAIIVLVLGLSISSCADQQVVGELVPAPVETDTTSVPGDSLYHNLILRNEVWLKDRSLNPGSH